MRSISIAFAALGLLTAAPALAEAAADPNAPSFENGPVWTYGEIRTVDGHFDEYMAWLAGPWKQQQEGLKRAGLITGYKVLLVDSPREGEPDIILATQYANMAAFDRSAAEVYAIAARISGPIVQQNEQQASRSSIRTVLGSMTMREAVLK